MIFRTLIRSPAKPESNPEASCVPAMTVMARAAWYVVYPRSDT